MNTSDPHTLDIVAAILAKPKYSAIQPELVERLVQRELAKGRKPKEAVKEVSAKLHQVGAAYFKLAPHYDLWKAELEHLPGDPAHENVRAFCLKVLQAHSSTAERLPILEDFFKESLASLAPVESLTDLACGLNPLALPWMPLARGARYSGCDIFSDLVEFDNAFLKTLRFASRPENGRRFHGTHGKDCAFGAAAEKPALPGAIGKGTREGAFRVHPCAIHPGQLPHPQFGRQVQGHAPNLLRPVRGAHQRQWLEGHAFRFSQ